MADALVATDATESLVQEGRRHDPYSVRLCQAEFQTHHEDQVVVYDDEGLKAGERASLCGLGHIQGSRTLFMLPHLSHSGARNHEE